MQANWWGQMHCGQPNQNFGRAMTHPAHPVAPSMLQCRSRMMMRSRLRNDDYNSYYNTLHVSYDNVILRTTWTAQPAEQCSNVESLSSAPSLNERAYSDVIVTYR